MGIPQGGSGAIGGTSARDRSFLHPCCLCVKKVLTNYFAKGSVSVSPVPHGIPTTEPAFIE